MDPILQAQILQGIRRPSRYVRVGMDLSEAIARSPANATIVLAPGEYTDAVVIPANKPGLVIIGAGGRGSAFIAAPDDGVALTNKAADVTLLNVGLEGDGTGAGLVNTGARFRASGCKIEGGTRACVLSVGAEAAITDGSDGTGADVLLEDCEICWSVNGLVLQASDYGAVTQARIRDCLFHNLDTTHITEQLAAGASAPVMFRDLDIDRCRFRGNEDGTEPTSFIDLNGDVANTGVVSGCFFPTALNSGLNLVAAGVLWIANYHPAGLSTGQPS